MTGVPTTRDEELGALLRSLEVPDHAPGFERELLERLTPARPRSWRRAARIVALAAALAAFAIGFGISRLGESSVEVASAAEIQARVQAAVSSVAHMQGRVVSSSRNPLTGAMETRRWRFAMTADGDFRLDELDGPGRVVYSSATGIERQLNTSASTGSGLFGSERTGLAPGPPDPGPSDWILQREMGAVVRALLAAHDPRVTEIRVEGRESWRVDLPVRPNAIFADADHLAVTVDQATGIPVRVVETLNGELRRELAVEDLRLDAPLAAGLFALRFPDDVEVFRTDEGFRRPPLGRVESAVGYAPLVPSWVPPGFTLAEVAVAEHAQPTGTEAGNPASEHVVSLAYRRGFDELLVTTRLPGSGHWDDPLATGEGFVDLPTPVELRQGALAGVRAQLLIAPRGIPHLWAVGSNLVVTVSGDVGKADLLRVTESLARR